MKRSATRARRTPEEEAQGSSPLEAAALRLREAVRPCVEAPPAAAPYVLNPLDYAWPLHQAYLRRYGPAAGASVEAVLVGMNPGPWGMAQTGVPFGSPDLVRDFLGLAGEVEGPAGCHPKRPILGLQSPRTEVSGQRLWGGIRACFGAPEPFFRRFFVLNDCPLVWQNERGGNVTPDKLDKAYMAPCLEACDQHLREALLALGPRTAIGVGKWAERRLRHVVERFGLEVDVQTILHPSPASPVANRGWLEQARGQLAALGHPWPAPASE
ncbi:MAG: uracil-DNA glycosylase family protein [Planctomycetota bacterium]